MRIAALTTAVIMSALVLVSGGHAAHAAPKQENKQTEKSQTVTIKPGDSLSKIAKANDSTTKRLYFANTTIKNPDLIYPGDKLRVPSETEKLTPRAMPTTPVAAPAAAAVPAPAQQQHAAAPAPVRTVQRSAPVSAAPVASGSVWDQLAACESGGNWSINTGNGFYGGLQFTPSSWQAVGGTGLPSDASREEQIMRAESLKAIQGWGAWPACTAKLGLR